MWPMVLDGESRDGRAKAWQLEPQTESLHLEAKA